MLHRTQRGVDARPCLVVVPSVPYDAGGAIYQHGVSELLDNEGCRRFAKSKAAVFPRKKKKKANWAERLRKVSKRMFQEEYENVHGALRNRADVAGPANRGA